MTDKITAWARKNCKTFTSRGDAEQPLAHTLLFNQYCALFEQLMEAFLSRNNMSIIDFHRALQDEQSLCERGGNMKGLNTTFASVLLSATDFFDFCQMMYDVNEGGEAVFCPPLIDCEDDAEDDAKPCPKYFSECKRGRNDQFKAQSK